MELGLCKGKKLYDKRDAEAKRKPSARWDRQNNKGEKLLMSNPIVTIEMEDGGSHHRRAYPEIAPKTVHNFISLVKKGFYDGLIFHRSSPAL